MKRRSHRRQVQDRLGQHLAQALALALAAAGCTDEGGGGSDARIPEQFFDGGGGCAPGERWLLAYCAPVEDDGGAADEGAADGGAEDASEADAGADAVAAEGPDAGSAADGGADAGRPFEVDPAANCLFDPRGPAEVALELPPALCRSLCGTFGQLECSATAEGVACVVPEFCGVGRRPAGSAPGEALPRRLSLGAWLGAAAGLEAASVGAFEALARDLRRLRAPRALVRAARRAAEDERRHARSVGALARRHGDALRPWAGPTPAPPSAFELALENRLEGCVRETLGAAVAAYQGARATDPAIARAFAVIAREEAEHGRLAWRVAAWLEPQLTAAERAALDTATEAALAAVEVAPLSAADRARAGLPEAGPLAALRDGLRALWRLPPAAALAAA